MLDGTEDCVIGFKRDREDVVNGGDGDEAVEHARRCAQRYQEGHLATDVQGNGEQARKKVRDGKAEEKKFSGFSEVLPCQKEDNNKDVHRDNQQSDKK